MPYIAPEDRADLEPHSTREAMTPGELNFQITCLIDGYMAGNLDYQSINDVQGALACVMNESYRRVAVPYEEQKKELNGDVFVTRVRPIGAKKAKAN